MSLTWSNVLAWRVHQHYLDRPAPANTLLDVTERLCGLHAQVLSSSELTLWARTQHLPRNALQHALWQQRELVKVWAMRGTLHLFASRDYPMWQAALSQLRREVTPAWLKWYDITRPELDQLMRTMGEVLDGQLLTRQELAEQVAKHTGSPELAEKVTRSSWGSLLKPPTRLGYLCFAPSAGQNVRFTRPSSWLKDWRPADPDASLLEVGRRFLHAYGPATITEFGRWWGGAAAPTARRAFKQLGDEVTTVELDGKRMWLLATDLADMRSAEPQHSVRLLPAFDQYVVGAPRDGAAVLRPELKSRVYRNQGWFSPVLLVDGRMLGVWRHARSGSRLKVDLEPFEDLPRWVRRSAEQEAERLAAFLGGKLELTWASIS
jgi:hypothetical protein